MIAFGLVVSFFFFKQKTAYEMRISDWSSDVCSSDLPEPPDSRTGRSHGSCSDIVDSIENGGGQFTLCPECFVPSETGCPPQPLPHPAMRRWPRHEGTDLRRRSRRTHAPPRSEEHTSELQSLMRTSYAVFCLKKKTNI